MISFPCNRVTNSILEGKAELKHKINNKKVMGTDNLIQLFTCFDSWYEVHPDPKSHTGGFISFGYEIVHYDPSKQELDTKRFNEYKSFIVSDHLTYSI